MDRLKSRDASASKNLQQVELSQEMINLKQAEAEKRRSAVKYFFFWLLE